MSSGRIAIPDIAAEWLEGSEFRADTRRWSQSLPSPRRVIEARGRARMTQAQVARAMGTTRPSSRLEGGRVKPSTRTLERVAKATGTRLRIRFQRDATGTRADASVASARPNGSAI